MKYAIFLSIALSLSSCCRTRGDIWEDTKTAGRYFGKGFTVLTGGSDSYEAYDRVDFYPQGEEYGYVAFEEEESQAMLGMQSVEPPRETPGDPGCRLPSVEAFIDPSTDPELANSFQSIPFAFDNSQITQDVAIARVRAAASYMKSHPKVYLFVEGHCDQRGFEAYNLALGSRRANMVRNMLVAEGVSKDHVFTISYGKERPILLDNSEQAHQTNRRAEFKVYKPS